MGPGALPGAAALAGLVRSDPHGPGITRARDRDVFRYHGPSGPDRRPRAGRRYAVILSARAVSSQGIVPRPASVRALSTMPLANRAEV
jgi:hypothetical protein